MLVLGWHGGVKAREAEDYGVGYSSHDGAAVLLRDGVLVAAIEEERLNRVKHSNFFPAHAIRYCLEEAGVTISDLDIIVTDCLEEVLDAFILGETLNDSSLPVLRGRQWLARLFQAEFGVDLFDKIRCYRHHSSHLYSAWIPSGFKQALLVSIDGEGDGLAGQIAAAGPAGFEVLRNLPAADSVGAFFTQAITLLGYRRFDEYKVMGLAPYGDPAVYRPLFQSLYELLPEGQYRLAGDDVRLGQVLRAGLVSGARRKGEPFTQAHQDFAAGLQEMLESIVFHILRHFRDVTGLRYLALSGGVAHNCTLNGKILQSGLFDQVYVQPAAHDAGNALGAAFGVVRDAGQAIAPNPLPHLFWGPDLEPSDGIAARLRAWEPLIQFRKTEDAPGEAARLIAAGEVIGWVQGRSEFGPRALGNRSILADPRPAENKKLINAMIKKREGYRPFAPAVLEERVRDYFEVPEGTDALPFMIFVLPVRPERRELLGAVTHVDGTARVQTVSAAVNPRFYALIEAFGRETGVPVVLNTSFNNNAEPIVQSIDDAVTAFLTTGIHHLVIGDFVVEKVEMPALLEGLLRLVPVLPAHRKLVRRLPAPQEPAYRIESTANSYFADPAVAISPEMFRLLLDDSDGARLGERLTRLGFTAPETRRALLTEAFDLWQRRAFWLRPDC